MNNLTYNITNNTETELMIQCCDETQIWLIILSLIVLVILCWIMTLCCRKKTRRNHYDMF